MNDVVVVNENDEVVGTIPKVEAHSKGVPHRIAVVYVENDEGEILVQSRVDGYLDHSAAGHVEPGESYKEAAKRELFEELGIKGVPLNFIGHGRTWNEKYPNQVVTHFFDIFTCKAKPGNLQQDEVKTIYWRSPEKILEDMNIDKNKYCEGFIESLKIYVSQKNNQER